MNKPQGSECECEVNKNIPGRSECEVNVNSVHFRSEFTLNEVNYKVNNQR